MIAYLIIAAVLPAFILAQLPIFPCPGLAESAPSALRIRGCDSFPCEVGHHIISPNDGYDFHYEVDFNAHLPSVNLTLSVFRTALGQQLPIELTDDLRNACNGLIGGSCPVQAHEPLTHGAHIEATEDLHGGIPVEVRIEIADDAHICMCTLINLIVV